jgi:hypothetical protein
MSKKADHEARIFYADTRFEKLARRPGGVPREQAIAAAQSEVKELEPGFTIWLEREMQELTAALLRVNGNSPDTLSLECAYRSCAQLRDVGSTLGYDLVTFVARNLCEILDAIKAGAAYDKETIELHVSALFLAKSDAYRQLRPDQVPEMATGLRRVVKLINNSQTSQINNSDNGPINKRYTNGSK